MGISNYICRTKRKSKNYINIRFIDSGNNKTRIHFLNVGWREGNEWDKTYEYFVTTWGNVVLARYQYRFANGPIDWKTHNDYPAFYLVKNDFE